MTPPQKPVSQNAHVVLKLSCKVLIPLILIFGLYVQFHGEVSAGGGFQAGVVMASSVILYGLVFGMKEAQAVVPPIAARIGAALGVLIYGGVGVINLAMGGNYLDFSALPGANHTGITLVEVGVLFTVTSVMVLIFYAFAGRARDIPDEDW